jgi:hypothetical protein
VAILDKISKNNNEKESLSYVLDSLLMQAKGNPMSLRDICEILSGKGYAIMFIVFSAPLCPPITLPGISTPLGLLLGFLGLRLAFSKKLWWPERLLMKTMSYSRLEYIVQKTQYVAKKLQKILYPRLSFLATHPMLHCVHGLIIFVLAMLLAMPLPIPATNTISALPIFCMGLGLLEDDGIAIIIAYLLALVCFAVFGVIFWMGEEGLYSLINST